VKIAIALKSSPTWHSAASLAKEQYRQHYGADISPNPDCFVFAVPETADGPEYPEIEIAGCCGFTYGANHRLFSERYLPQPIDAIIEQATGTAVTRQRVVEFGPLASRGAMVGFELIGILPIIAWFQGMEFALCTVTPQIRRAMTRCLIPFKVITNADYGSLEENETRSWGTYFETHPLTVVISLRDIGQVFARATGKYRYNLNESDSAGLVTIRAGAGF
jgi:hypothetical protein